MKQGVENIYIKQWHNKTLLLRIVGTFFSNRKWSDLQ